MTERKKEKPENTRERKRKLRQKLKEIGLSQVAVYVPTEDKKKLHDYALKLRIEAGKLAPTDKEK